MTSGLSLRQLTAEQVLPLRAAVLRAGQPVATARLPKDDVAGHFGLYDGERLVSVGTIHADACDSPYADEAMKRPECWRLRGMATDAEYRGRGCGVQVLRACLDYAWARGAPLVWANARIGAMNFYLRNGFEQLGEEYEIPGIGPHFLIRIDRQKPGA
jgi:GNAT superfamily N-acetyltransferase